MSFEKMINSNKIYLNPEEGLCRVSRETKSSIYIQPVKEVYDVERNLKGCYLSCCYKYTNEFENEKEINKDETDVDSFKLFEIKINETYTYLYENRMRCLNVDTKSLVRYF
jgi:hypothetical protein